MKKCFAFLAVGVASVATAQDIKFWLAHSDSAWAQKNGAKVGDELKAVNDVTGFQSINVTSEGRKYGAGGIMFAFDSAVTGAKNYVNRTAFEATQLDKISNFKSITWNSGPPGCYEDCNLPYPAPLGPLGFSGVAGADESLRPIGLWQAFGFGTGMNLFVPAGGTEYLAEVTMDVDTNKLWRRPDQTYGDDPEETGLMMFGQPNSANSRHCYLGASSGTGRYPTTKYALMAVPEPGTSLILALGLGSLLKRRTKRAYSGRSTPERP